MSPTRRNFPDFDCCRTKTANWLIELPQFFTKKDKSAPERIRSLPLLSDLSQSSKKSLIFIKENNQSTESMPPKNNKNNHLSERNFPVRLAATFSWFGWLVISCVFLGLTLFTFTGEQLTPIRLFSYVASRLAVLLLFPVLPSFLLRKKLLGFSFLLSALLLGLPFINFFNKSVINAPTNQTYKIMTYSKMGRNHNINAVAEVVLNEKPDVLFMQEIDEQETANLTKLLSNIYDGAPVFYFTDELNGLILSRYKVTSLRKKGDFSQAAEIEFPENSARVWNVHLQKSFGNTDLQYQMVDQLAEQISTVNDPVIVAGDFNATVLNYPYKKINQHLENAFENAGSGFGFTFPSAARRMGTFAPFMRIDHIFYSSQFDVHQSYVVEQSGDSDHFPVVAMLSLKKD